MSMLPQELITGILYQLPAKSLVRFQAVSKSWHALINNLDFITMHLQSSIETRRECFFILQRQPWCITRAYMLVELPNENWMWEHLEFNQPSYFLKGFRHIRNPYNGLFCLYNDSGEIVVWNPSIRKHEKLPPVLIDAPMSYGILSDIAIGYDIVNKDYKVASIGDGVCKAGQLIGGFNVQVYNLKEKAWRRVKDQWPFKKSSIFGVGTYSHGNLHWLVIIPSEELASQDRVLVAFNRTTEKLRVYGLPPMESMSFLCLETLGGLLCVATNDGVWIMKEYGMVSSWTPLSTMPVSFSICKASMILTDGQEILFEKELMEYFWYDKEKKSRRIVEVLGIPGRSWSMPCKGNLVLLDCDSGN